jgi:transcription elongation factor GreA
MKRTISFRRRSLNLINNLLPAKASVMTKGFPPMENEKKTQYTEEGYRKLVDELQYLKDVRIPEIKVQIAEARAFGDLSENSEYDEAKNEQAKTVTRIAELEKLINEATIINESEIRADVVNLGSFVRVYDSDMDEEVEYNVVGSNEADPMQGRISDQSPLGSAMLGAKVGEEVTVVAPFGEYKVKILAVGRSKDN